MGAGDYVAYHVAFAEPSKSDSCYPNGKVPDDVANHSSTILTSATFYIFGSSDGTVYLDNDKSTLSGKVNDNGYDFAGETTDIMGGNVPGVCVDFDCNGGTCFCTGVVHAGTMCCDPTDPMCNTDPVCDTECCNQQPAGPVISLRKAISLGITVDGDMVSGSEREHDTSTCLDVCDNFIETDCLTSTDFTGSKIENVDLRHDI